MSFAPYVSKMQMDWGTEYCQSQTNKKKTTRPEKTILLKEDAGSESPLSIFCFYQTLWLIWESFKIILTITRVES